MDHRLEVAPSGRATCKTCGKTIGKGELRLGEAYESQFGSEGVAIRWHHLACGAAKLPEVLAAAMAAYDGEIPNRTELEAAMSAPPKATKKATGALPTADFAPTGRAKCIQCGAAIEKSSVRIAVEREVDTGSFVTKGAGYLHPACAEAWAEGEWDAGLDDLVAQVQANTGLDALPPPFGSAEATATEATGAAKKPAAKKPKKPAAETPSEVPALGSLSGKQIASLAQKLLKLKEDYKADSIFDKAKIDWGQRDPLRWHLAQHGLLPPSHPTLLQRLGDSASSASADAVFAVLPRITKAPLWHELAPGWPHPADAIALRAFQLDPVRLEALLESVPPAVRTGIQLVRGRHGATLPDADRKAVLRGLAYAEASQYGISRIHGQGGTRLHLKAIGADGKRSEPYTDVLDLARHFGTEEEWTDALAEACRAGRFDTLEHVSLGLARLPLAEMVALLAKKHKSSDATHDRRLADLLARRNDGPEALLAAARSIPADAHPGKYVREDLFMHALAGMKARGLPVPEGVEREMSWDLHKCSPWGDYDVKRAAYRAALEVIGRERALAMARHCIDRGYNHAQALPYLAVYWDEAMCREVLAKLEHADPADFAAIGPKTLPLLVEAMADEPPQGTTKEKRLAILRRSIQGVIALEGREGRGCDAAYDPYVSCEPSESYWRDELKKQLPLALAGMSDERRQATLDRLFSETKQPERPFTVVWAVESAAYREKAARILVQRYSQVMDPYALRAGLRALPAGSLSSFRAALLEEKPDPKLFQELKDVFGEKEVDAIMKEGGVKDEKPFDRLLRLSRERIAAGAAKTRIYLLERPDLGRGRDGEIPAPRPGSFTRVRGTGAGIDRSAHKLGEREHILTLDLSEVPELGRPGVKAIALYAEDPEHGDGWERARLVDVPEGAAPPTDGKPVAVVPLEVPSEIFLSSAERNDPVLKEIRNLVFNRPGYVLGQPMFIQEDQGGGGFVMQLAERIADLNLGDSGSLYVFDDAIFMQCY